jgi:4-amino-4-deoxy-L-arabinose transferase-like glycosyltransferase
MGVILRLLLLRDKSLWADEGVGWWMALGEIEHDAPAIYRYAFGWAVQLFGWNEFASRLPSALFGVLSVAVIYAIGKSVFDRRFGLYAAALSSISAYLIPLSQELRIYSLLGLELWLVLWCFLMILRDEQAHIGWWIGFLLVGIAGQYTHCFFIFVLLYLGAVLIFIRGWEWRPHHFKYLAVIVIVLLLALPEVLNTLTVASERRIIYAGDLSHLKMSVFRVLRAYFGFLFGDYLTNLPGTIIPYLKIHPIRLATGLAMTGTWIALGFLASKQSLRMARRGDFQALGVRIFIGMMGVFTLLFVVIDVSTSGHLIFVYVPFVFLLATFWRRHGALTMIITSLFLVLTATSLIAHYTSPTFVHERADWRAAGTLLKQKLESTDTVLLLRGRDAYYTLKFYFPGMKCDLYYQPRHDPALLESEKLMNWWAQASFDEKVSSLLGDHTRVWVLESELAWNPGEGLDDCAIQRWDFGYNLQVHLVETGVSGADDLRGNQEYFQNGNGNR